MPEKMRQERDGFGEVDVPFSAHYGAQTQRAINNFPISELTMPRAFIRALGLIKCACADVNRDLGLLDAERAEALSKAAFEVAGSLYDSEFPVDVFQTGSGTSSNMNANEVIANLASAACGLDVHPNDHVNLGQSSNDVIPSCIHLAASLEIIENLLPALTHLASVIEQKGDSLKDEVKTGRTHLMDAMPVTFGQELGAWAAQIHASEERIEGSLQRLSHLALGGTAVGTGINAHPEFGIKVIKQLSIMTGLEFRQDGNLFQGLSAQDASVEMSGQLKTLAVSLMKISNDLRWMNSGPLAGLGEINLPALQPGSSIMPGKVNPVIPESVMMVAAQVIGNDATICVAGQSGNFQLNVMLPVIAYNLLQSIHLLSSAARALADKAIAGFSINHERIDETLARNPILVTALNNHIGYEKGAAIAKKAYAERRSIIDVAREMTELTEEELTLLLDPMNLT